jgi:AraC-like DNA-binding protein
MYSKLHARLPFGNRDPIVDGSLSTLRDKIAKAVPGEFSLDALHSQTNFFQASSTISFGKLSLTALATTPVRVNRKSETKRTLVIPYSGDFSAFVERKTYRANPRTTGVFFSGRPREGLMGENFSELLVELDEDYLQEVADAMLGSQFNPSGIDLRLDQDREVALNVNGVSLDSLIRNQCRTVDDLWGKTDAMRMMGLDNAFYRAFVALLAPKQVFGRGTKTSSTKTAEADVVHRVCDYIQAHLENPITLTELEQIAGISARRLQYAFLHRFGCSPMEWLRGERLNLAHARLRAPHKGMTVTSVAHGAGFSHLSAFASQYRARFGESPSATLKRALDS